jgi:hypothetical protein
VNALWEKEVLLLRGTFKIPPIKKGHRYRLRINDGDHVGAGGGHIVYINGKQLIEGKQCGGRGSGGKVKGAYITSEFLKDFQGGEVTVAIKTFLRFNSKYKVKPTTRTPQGKISLHLEEQKLPPMGDDLVTKSAAVVPMLSSQWQAMQGLEERDKPVGDQEFRWDGKFVTNPKLLGTWSLIGQVKTVEEFDPKKKPRRVRAPFARITFKDKAMTSELLWMWSGDTLMDLSKYQALKMQVKKIDDSEYLFVESGGFSTGNKPGWKSPLYVLKKQTR